METAHSGRLYQSNHLRSGHFLVSANQHITVQPPALLQVVGSDILKGRYNSDLVSQNVLGNLSGATLGRELNSGNFWRHQWHRDVD